MTFAFGLVFARVAISVASWFAVKSEPILPIWTDPLPAVKVNLSEVRISVVPSALMSEYLSSSNGKNVSFVPADTAELNWSFDASITTSNNFLILSVALDISTSDILSFGISVNRVLSLDFSKGVDTSVRSGTSKDDPWVANRAPSVTPVTVVTPVTTTFSVFTSVILTNDFKLFPNPPNFNIFPTFNFPGNWGFPHVIVLIETLLAVPTPVILDEPKINWSFWTISPWKVFANPTSPVFWSVNPGPANIVFTSDIPNDVIARATRVFSTPLNMSGSFGIISPCVSYKVSEVLFDTADLKKPVAPLNLPSTNTGVESVWFVFKVTSVNVWISYNEMSNSLTSPFVAL